MAGIVIREMELDDIPEVFALGERYFTAEDWPSLYRTWDEYELVTMFASDGETCLVAEENDEIVGFVLGTLIEKRRSAWTYGYLVWLCVRSEQRGSGVARRLTDRLTELFIRDGARMMIVDTDAENEPAIRFFRKQGFGGEREHVYFSKNLTGHPKYRSKRPRRAVGHRKPKNKKRPANADQSVDGED
jgi:ribosomal protein S18 acetylase RimI-like enzyme